MRGGRAIAKSKRLGKNCRGEVLEMTVASPKDFPSKAISLLANSSLLGHCLHSQDFRTVFQIGGSPAESGRLSLCVYVCHACTHTYIC